VLDNILYELFSILYVLDSILYELFSILYVLDSILYVLFSILYVLFSILYVLFSILYVLDKRVIGCYTARAGGAECGGMRLTGLAEAERRKNDVRRFYSGQGTPAGPVGACFAKGAGYAGSPLIYAGFV
jgi:hypothetical protein